MGMELQLRQTNFETFSTGPVSLRTGMNYEEAKNIMGAMCIVRDDKTKEWYVRMPHLESLGDTSLVSPELFLLPDDGQGLHEYMLEPPDPVKCLPDQDDPFFCFLRTGADECKHGGPGSTMNFWAQSSHRPSQSRCIRQLHFCQCQTDKVSSQVVQQLEVFMMGQIEVILRG